MNSLMGHRVHELLHSHTKAHFPKSRLRELPVWFIIDILEIFLYIFKHR